MLAKLVKLVKLARLVLRFGVTLYKRGGVDGQLETEMFLMLFAGACFTYVLVVLLSLLWKYKVVLGLLWHYLQNAGVPSVPAVPAASGAAFGEAVDVLFFDSDDAASDAASGETADGLFWDSD